jgi:glutamyl-Q tRNA(Asp) synthetase
LHLGHAYSALFAYKQAKESGGKFILRIEDIDPDRCRPEFVQGIYDDLEWLGLTWETPVRVQSEHLSDYKAALDKLQSMGLLYPCFCTRKDIQDEAARSGHAPHGPEGVLYAGTCRGLSESERDRLVREGKPFVLRLNMGEALRALPPPLSSPLETGGGLTWLDRTKGIQTATPEILGDVVLARKDVMASYHLCVTLDDHIQGVTLVTRGEDLFYATHLHRLLQHLLGLNAPEWHHHGLLLDHEGKRFAKRNQSVTLQHLREVEKWSPQQVMDRIGIAV